MSRRNRDGNVFNFINRDRVYSHAVSLQATDDVSLRVSALASGGIGLPEVRISIEGHIEDEIPSDQCLQEAGFLPPIHVAGLDELHRVCWGQVIRGGS